MVIHAPLWILLVGMGSAFLAGFCLKYWVHARRFERRNHLGLEHFASYSELMSSRFVEGAAQVFGNVLVGVGLLFVLLVAARELLPGWQ